MENAARKEAQKVPKDSVKSELYQDYLTMPIHKDALMKFLLTAALRELIMTFFVHFPERINMWVYIDQMIFWWYMKKYFLIHFYSHDHEARFGHIYEKFVPIAYAEAVEKRYFCE